MWLYLQLRALALLAVHMGQYLALLELSVVLGTFVVQPACLDMLVALEALAEIAFLHKYSVLIVFVGWAAFLNNPVGLVAYPVVLVGLNASQNLLCLGPFRCFFLGGY